MLRIHFTRADLARTRFAPAADPLWELALSMHQLRLRDADPLLAGWRRRVAGSLRDIRGEVDLLSTLNPPRGYFPDFLTPIEAGGGIEAGIDAVLSTPKPRLRHEIGQLAGAAAPRRPTVDGIRRGEARSLHDLGAAMRHYFRVALATEWPRVTAVVDGDLGRRARQLAAGGWVDVLNALHPTATFDGRVLHVGVWGRSDDLDLRLGDRGMVLVPSYYKETRQLMVLADPALPPVLVYPVSLAVRVSTDAGSRPLEDLLGRTRAAVLATVQLGGSTSQLARRLPISLPAMSKHLAVLRRAGLVDSVRDRNTVHHTLTPLGRALLLARAAPR